MKDCVFLLCFLSPLVVSAIQLPSDESIQRAKEILDKNPVIDGHNDFPMWLRILKQNDLREVDFDSDLTSNPDWAGSYANHVDLPRIREGRLGGQFWSAFIGCSSQFKDAVQLTLEQIDVIKRLVEANPDQMEFVTTAAGIEEAFANGKVASLIGLESGHGLGSNLGILRMVYELGVRYVTLTHSCNTPWADSTTAETGSEVARSHGLSSFGLEVVAEMNRLGMLVDLSHVSAETMKDALDFSIAPIIFSHSSARALCSYPRNVPDDILRQVTQNGGIVMVNFYNFFINCDNEDCGYDNCPANVYDVAAHINHIRKVAGVDHVGIGADFCGVELTPEGAEDVSKYPVLFAALLESEEMEWTEEDLAKLASKNLIRVFKGVEAIRDELAQVPPFQDWIPQGDVFPEEETCSTN